jgi:molybdate transport system substrate-binding protein
VKRWTGALVAAVSISACGTAEDTDRALVVFAAASLTEAFGEIGAEFEDLQAGVSVRFSFGPSDGLATQIREGAPADVFASASERWMDEAAAEGLRVRTVFARNRLAVLIPRDNPAGIRGMEDLARPGVRLVLAAPDVPAGEYAREALARAGILARAEANVVSNEEDVKGVVQKVALGEADAGIAYVTDLTEAVARDIRGIAIPASANVTAPYPIAILGSSDSPGMARRFLDYVLGDGQAILRRAGFLPP